MATDRTILEKDSRDWGAHVRIIAEELRMGFEAVDQIPRPAVTIFGSARTKRDSYEYEQARICGRAFAEAGFAVVTGGGPGIMEAANRGAKEGGGFSAGFNIQLPHEQDANPYLDLSATFLHFYARKVALVKAAEGFVLFPGGFGTLDELFESLTLIQTDKVRAFPVSLVGEAYWRGLIEWIAERPLAEHKISPEDVDLLHITDDVLQAVEAVRECWEQLCAEPVHEPKKADAQ